MCDPLVERCLFSTTLEINLGEQNVILDDYQARLSFDSITKTWLNARNECTNHTENYWGINIDSEPLSLEESRSLSSSSFSRSRRRGRSKGLCRGDNCPKRVVFSEPDRRRRLEDEKEAPYEDRCDPSFLKLLQESDPTYFGKLEEIELAFDVNVENENLNKCTTDSCTTQFNTMDRICADFGIVYDQSAHECSWNYVNCDVDSLVVTSLSFFMESITSTIPSEIALLQELEWFYVPRNNLSGAIPTEVGLLSRLQGFTLPSNKLTGAIPTEMGNSGALTVIDLSNNNIDGTIPTELGDLQLLEKIMLAGNILNGTIPTDLFFIKRLERLDLSRNNISGTIPKEIGSLQLRYLDLSSNNLMGPLPPEMNELADTIEFIDLRGNNLTGVLPPELCDKLPDYDPDDETFVCEFTGDNSPSPTNMETLSPTGRNDLDCSKKYSSSSYEIKYVKKRPHCDNLPCFFTDRARFETLCNDFSDCDGFSYTTDDSQEVGRGCLLRCVEKKTQQKFEYGPYNYWEKKITSRCGHKYDFFPYVDSPGHDIGNFTDSSLEGGVEALKKICDVESNCKGFNSNGWFKDFVKPRNQWTEWTNDASQGLYVKKEVLTAPVVTNRPSFAPSTIVFPVSSPPTSTIPIPTLPPTVSPSLLPSSASPTAKHKDKNKKKDKQNNKDANKDKNKNNNKDQNKDKDEKNRNNIFD